MDLNQRYPCVDDMAIEAQRRIPRFAFEYLSSGIGREVGLNRNRQALDTITFRPRYLPKVGPGKAGLQTKLLGQNFDLPFGITPLGLSGLMWPGAAEIAARAAKNANIPIGLSSFATARMEKIRDIAGENAWYQYYPVNDDEMQKAMLTEIAGAGYQVLIVTVDIPTEARRDRDLRVGLSVPPKINLRTMAEVSRCPRWALATAMVGRPEFVNLLPHMPKGQSMAVAARSILDRIEGHVTKEKLTRIRDLWKGKLIVKGILHPEDAKSAAEIGADAIWVSNHGGRQLDAARASVEVLPEIRATLGPTYPIMVDSGPRTGLDIARMLALGADFVFLGRAFIYGIAAIGGRGADHVCHVLREELRTTLGQIGCQHIPELRDFLD